MKDVLIVGAGPAGLMAAIRLAELGYSVTIFEKEHFPHVKTCGDLVTLEGLNLLAGVGLGDWMERFRRVDELRFSSPAGQVLDIPVCDTGAAAHNRILPREHLDAQLAQRARAAGAELREGCRVQEALIDRQNKQVCVRTTDGSTLGRMLLLADGSHAPITRKLGLLREAPDLMAARQYLRVPGLDALGPLEFHFQREIIPGYTWLFPQGDYGFNLGCGTYTARVKRKELDLSAVIEDFKRHDPILAGRLEKAEALGPVKAHPLRTHVGGTRTHGDHFLVLGDAAGLVSPFTGEGITSGMLSGVLAARFVSDAFACGDWSAAVLAPYTQTLKTRFAGDHQAAYVLRATLREPRLLDHFFRSMAADRDLARTFALAYLDEVSPQLLLHLRNLLKLLRKS